VSKHHWQSLQTVSPTLLADIALMLGYDPASVVSIRFNKRSVIVVQEKGPELFTTKHDVL
jgi:hypothetical protein